MLYNETGRFYDLRVVSAFLATGAAGAAGATGAVEHTQEDRNNPMSKVPQQRKKGENH